jgi:hypothetical protein
MSKIEDPDFATGLDESYVPSQLPVCTGGFEPRVGLPHEFCWRLKNKSGCGSAILCGRLLGKFEILLTTIYTVYTVVKLSLECWTDSHGAEMSWLVPGSWY